MRVLLTNLGPVLFGLMVNKIRLPKDDDENVHLNNCLLDLAFEWMKWHIIYVMPEHIIPCMPAKAPPDRLLASNRNIACAPQKPILKNRMFGLTFC